jgi:hypothetical protein
MTVQRSVLVRNARLDSIQTAIGVSAKVMAYTGLQPATCATVASGTLLITWSLASSWAAAASAGVKSFSNTPVAGTAAAAGTVGYYRIYDSTGTTCHEQGSIGTSGTDLVIDNAVLAVNQVVNITGWSITEPSA